VRAFEIVTGAITALAALGALFFAWRTVHEAREAAADARRYRATARLETIVELVAKIRLSNQAANRVLSGTYQDRLRPLVAASEGELPKTYELSERQFTADSYGDDERLAIASLDELREAVRRLGTE
jgi:hypothetical protein